MKLGFIGLGRMGNRMVMKLLKEGHEVVVWNRHRDKVDDLMAEAQKNWMLSAADNIKDLIGSLKPPRIIWSMLPAGDATVETLFEIEKSVVHGDIIIDGGNAYFEDTQRRCEHFRDIKIAYLGIGVSGGVVAFEQGYPLMVGGDWSAYEFIKPILDSLAKPGGGHEYFGEGGAGHFVKMIHNGIEYGIMQSIGEGFGILEKSPYNLDLLKVAELYQKGTLNSGFMMQRTIEALESDPRLVKIDGYIEASGEGDWTVKQGEKLKVPVGIIKASLDFRTKSREDKKVSTTFAARMVAALRFAFGRHDVKKK